MTPTTNALSRIAAALVIAAAVATAAAQPMPETAFTVQARVLEAGAPAAGAWDIEAALYDSPTGCCQVGPTQSVPGIHMVDGAVILELDFGVLGDDARWLELRLQPMGGGGWTTLEPRLHLSPVPLAIRAQSAAQVDGADDAALLDGQPASYYMEWSHHTSVPADLADGDEDTAAALSCGPGQVAVWSSSAWACGDDAGQRYVRTHVISPVGDPVANGAALLAVVNAIPTPSGADEARLVKIEPGRYDLGTGSLEMKPWIDVEGSGQLTTVLVSNGVITVQMDQDSELRGIAVENLCDISVSAGYSVSCVADRCRITDVTVRASGASKQSEGIYLDGDAFVIRRVTASASEGSLLNRGVYVSASTGGVLEDIVAYADGGSNAVGVMTQGCEAVHRIVSRAVNATTETQGAQLGHVRWVSGITAVASSSSGSTVGLYLNGGPSFDMTVTDVTARGDTALAAQSSSGGVFHVTDSRLEGATTGATFQLYTNGVLEIQNSTVSGATNTVANPGATIRVAGSQLLGGPVSGTVSCAGVSDETHAFYASTCP